MTKISRFNVDPKYMGKFLKNFWRVVTLLENMDQVKDFLYDLLTPTEMKMFAKRLQIAKMLLEGYDYQAIRNFVKVTDQTIARINNQLELRGGGYRNAVVALQKIEKELDEERMGRHPLSDALKKYPEMQLPNRISGSLEQKAKQYRKKRSALR